MSGNQVRKFPADHVIFKEGDQGDCAYLIEKGSVLIYLVKDGNEIPLKVAGEGEVFGEMALIDDEPRSASCRTTSDTQLIVVSKEQLMGRIRAADPVVRLLMQALLERLRRQNDRLRGKPLAVVDKVDPHAADKKEVIELINLEHRIARALDNDEFEPFYQPIYDLKTGDVMGCEALIRWISKDKGIISPAVFMDTLEESPLMIRAGQVVIEKATRDLAAMHGRHGGDFFVSINVSGSQFTDASFISHLEEARKKSGFPAHQIKLELTERIMMQGQQPLDTLHDCRALGYKLAIDDFGTGFSSLQYLSQMPLTDLKIDRGFVMKMTQDQRSLSIIKSLIYMANLLGMRLIAEGVETPGQLQSLQVLGVQMAQGFLFSKPLPLADFLKIPTNFSAKAA